MNYIDRYYKNKFKLLKRKNLLKQLPRGTVFSQGNLEEACRLCNVKVPVEKLIEYGEGCNWLTRKGKPFQSIAAFVNSYNGVWLQENKKNRDFKFDLFSFKEN